MPPPSPALHPLPTPSPSPHLEHLSLQLLSITCQCCFISLLGGKGDEGNASEPASIREGHEVQLLDVTTPPPVLTYLVLTVMVGHATNKHLTTAALREGERGEQAKTLWMSTALRQHQHCCTGMMTKAYGTEAQLLPFNAPAA